MKIVNRRAKHDYTILDRFEAGIKLSGPEVKSVKQGRASLKGAYVRLIDGQAHLINAQIQPYEYARQLHYDPGRTRRLLLKKKQIISLLNKIESERLTLIPLSLYTVKGWVKVGVGLARGKKQYEKRAKLKLRDQKRELEREHRGKIK